MGLEKINIAEPEMEILNQAVEDPMRSLRSLLKNNLLMFLKFFWPEYSQDDFHCNWHIEYICSELEIVARRVANKVPTPHDLIINVPPGSTKTAIVSIMFPLWCWVNWHHFRFIVASYTAPLSLESAEYSRDIIRSERFQQIFPEIQVKEDKDTKSNFRVVKLDYHRVGYAPRVILGGNRFSTSVGGSVTGFHAHIIIWDDPIDPNKVVSEREIEKANHWMKNTLPFRKVDKAVTPTIGIMQRLHQNDPTGHLLALRGEERIKHICIPGEIFNYRHKVKPPELVDNYVDGLLDPKRLNKEALKKYEELGQYTYGGQIGQDPVPLGGGMFKVDNFTVIENMPYPQDIEKTVRFWDKAGTEGGDGAYTCGVKVCRTKQKRFIVLDVKRGRWSSETRERIIKAVAEADGGRVEVVVEQEPGSGGKESAQNTIRNLAGFTVHADRPTGNKALRADPASVQVNNGNVSLLRGDWNKDFIDELRFFPNSTFKDQTDAFSGAFSRVNGMKMAKVNKR